jgi:hypothetical protein
MNSKNHARNVYNQNIYLIPLVEHLFKNRKNLADWYSHVCGAKMNDPSLSKNDPLPNRLPHTLVSLGLINKLEDVSFIFSSDTQP